MADMVTVEVVQGTLRGRKTTTKCGNTLYSFQGVPYANPPVGPLRFKVAEPPAPWSGVRDALQEGNSCTQLNLMTKEYEGNEDCLYLNVYSPSLPSSGSENSLRPVMVWIHGGGFVCGSGFNGWYGPDYLVDDGVILVTINYRLGVLGFLCLDDPAAPGNIGLKDQVAALRWVQKNIAKFGGDADNITIFGESAGGASVHFHMLSPMSKGLFSRAIAQSAAAVNPWVLQRDSREAGFRLGEALGFSGTTPHELVEFLRDVDHLALVKAAQEHGLSEQDKERLLVFPFTPSLELEVEGDEIFLPGHPLLLLEEGRYHGVPFMTGITDKDGLIVSTSPELRKDEELVRLEQNLEKIILPAIRLPNSYGKKTHIISKFREFYLGDKPVSKDTLLGFVDMMTDMDFAEGIHIVVRKMAQLAKAPLYQYLFSFDGKLNLFKMGIGIPYTGACHGDELGYLFRAYLNDTDVAADSLEAQTRARMVRLWTNFAKTGEPTPGDDPLLPVSWEPHTAISPSYLEINKELSIHKHLLKERMHFWQELYRKL